MNSHANKPNNTYDNSENNGENSIVCENNTVICILIENGCFPRTAHLEEILEVDSKPRKITGPDGPAPGAPRGPNN